MLGSRFIIGVRLQVLKKALHRYMSFVKSVCKEEVQHFAEKFTRVACNLPNVFGEVLLCKKRYSIVHSVWDLAVGRDTPKLLEGVLNCFVFLIIVDLVSNVL